MSSWIHRFNAHSNASSLEQVSNVGQLGLLSSTGGEITGSLLRVQINHMWQISSVADWVVCLQTALHNSCNWPTVVMSASVGLCHIVVVFSLLSDCSLSRMQQRILCPGHGSLTTLHL